MYHEVAVQFVASLGPRIGSYAAFANRAWFGGLPVTMEQTKGAHL
jgi:hypothetical protein